MVTWDDTTRLNRLKSLLGIGIIMTAGVLMGIAELHHIQKMSSSLGIAVFALLPFIIDIGLVATGVVLWQSRFEGDEIVRITAWVLLGMAVMGVLATWTITHQNIRGRPFAHAPFVTVNNLSAGGLIGFVIGWYDTLRRRYEAQVETERARLEFVHSSLRHNVLNGLHIILGHADILEDKAGDSDGHSLAAIRNRSEELTRFTEATSALMANFRDQTEISTRPIHLSTVLTDELETAQQQYEDAELSGDLQDDVYIEGDEFVGELFYNLLTNALVHNDKPTPEVSVSAHRTDGTVSVRIADNGPGIPDEEKERMLEWNVKGPESPGTGLGLPIAATVAERYDGSLRIEDNDPQGTVITVELPTTSRVEPDAPTDAPSTS